MNKISINLLPQTVLLERIQSSKLSLVNKISIGVLVLVAFLTIGVLLLRVNQNRENEQITSQVKDAENKVSSYSSKEAEAFALKNRLDVILQKMGTDEKIKAMFNMLVSVIPPEVILSDAIVDKNGVITATFTSVNVSGLDKLFASLTNKESNLGLVSKVDLNGISLGKDSSYRFSLKIAD